MMRYILYIFLAFALLFSVGYLLSIEDWTRTIDVVRNADELQVFTVDKTGDGLEGRVIYSTQSPKEISEFASAMELKKTVAITHKGLIGLPLIKVLKNGQVVLQISSHNYQKLSSDECKLDGILKDPQAWRNWFEKRIPELKKK